MDLDRLALVHRPTQIHLVIQDRLDRRCVPTLRFLSLEFLANACNLTIIEISRDVSHRSVK